MAGQQVSDLNLIHDAMNIAYPRPQRSLNGTPSRLEAKAQSGDLDSDSTWKQVGQASAISASLTVSHGASVSASFTPATIHDQNWTLQDMRAQCAEVDPQSAKSTVQQSTIPSQESWFLTGEPWMSGALPDISVTQARARISNNPCSQSQESFQTACFPCVQKSADYQQPLGVDADRHNYVPLLQTQNTEVRHQQLCDSYQSTIRSKKGCSEKTLHENCMERLAQDLQAHDCIVPQTMQLPKICTEQPEHTEFETELKGAYNGSCIRQRCQQSPLSRERTRQTDPANETTLQPAEDEIDAIEQEDVHNHRSDDGVSFYKLRRDQATRSGCETKTTVSKRRHYSLASQDSVAMEISPEDQNITAPFCETPSTNQKVSAWTESQRLMRPFHVDESYNQVPHTDSTNAISTPELPVMSTGLMHCFPRLRPERHPPPTWSNPTGLLQSAPNDNPTGSAMSSFKGYDGSFITDMDNSVPTPRYMTPLDHSPLRTLDIPRPFEHSVRSSVERDAETRFTIDNGPRQSTPAYEDRSLTPSSVSKAVEDSYDEDSTATIADTEMLDYFDRVSTRIREQSPPLREGMMVPEHQTATSRLTMRPSSLSSDQLPIRMMAGDESRHGRLGRISEFSHSQQDHKLSPVVTDRSQSCPSPPLLPSLEISQPKCGTRIKIQNRKKSVALNPASRVNKQRNITGAVRMKKRTRDAKESSKEIDGPVDRGTANTDERGLLDMSRTGHKETRRRSARLQGKKSKNG